MTITLNLNKILLILGAVALAGPDIKAVSVWLESLGVSWLVPVSHGLAYVAVACAGLSRALPFVRPYLAKVGLTTPPGEKAPGPPAKKEGGGSDLTILVVLLWVAAIFGLGMWWPNPAHPSEREASPSSLQGAS